MKQCDCIWPPVGDNWMCASCQTALKELRDRNESIWNDGKPAISIRQLQSLPRVPGFADVDIAGTPRDQLEPPAWPDELPLNFRM